MQEIVSEAGIHTDVGDEIAPCQLRVLSTLCDLDEWVEAWRQLDERAGAPTQQFDWVRCNAARLSERERLNVVSVTQGDAVLAIAPLVTERKWGVRRDVLLGVAEHYEPMDLLYCDDSSLQFLVRQLARSSRPLTLGRTRIDSPTIAAIRDAFRSRAIVLTRPQASYAYLDLDPSWAHPEQRLNSRRRSDLRRARRRAEQSGPVSTEILSPDPGDVEQLLDEAFAAEARSWKGREGTAIACHQSQRAFFIDYARSAARSGILRICLLRIDGQVAAMQVSLVHGGGFWLLKIGYDEQFARCSPGMLLMADTIAYAAREGLQTYEFLGRSESWVDMWTRAQRKCVALRVYPRNVAGYTALLTDLAETSLRKGADRWQKVRGAARRSAKKIAGPLLRLAARGHIAGETLADALRVQRQLSEKGLAITIGFWDTEAQPGRLVADQYLAGLDGLAAALADSYLSTKLTALRFSPQLLEEVAAKARQTNRRLHFDGMWPEAADPTRKAIDRLLERGAAPELGVTLPGRWQRSLDDAEWAIRRGLAVRVVKGEWPDPADPDRDLRAGFLEVVDRLAGRARHVGVASHDVALAEEAIRRLQAAPRRANWSCYTACRGGHRCGWPSGWECQFASMSPMAKPTRPMPWHRSAASRTSSGGWHATWLPLHSAAPSGPAAAASRRMCGLWQYW